jgi:hypothetical protein
LTASSVVTPNVTYHIKLVIADRLDPQSDSAIFISSDSFNIGQDVLGQDLTIANGTALCYGTTHTLNSGLDPNTYTFVWKKDDNVIAGQTGPSLTITQGGNYSLTYNATFATCEPITDNVTIEYYPQINAANPNTLYKCDSGSATYNYNLDLNTSVVKAGLDPNTTVSYFATQNDANNNTNALPLVYNTASGTTIWVRIQLPNSPCYVVKSFQLQTAPGPVANQAPDLVACARSQALNNSFNLSQQTPIILGSQSTTMNVLTYHTSFNDATNDINPVTGNLSYALFPSTTIYVRVENASDPTCFVISSFNLIVNPVPVVDVLENVIACTSYTLQPLTNGNYFTQPNGGGTMMNAGDIITETTTLYIFNQPGGPNTCGANSMFKVRIIDPNTFHQLM